MSGKGQVCPHCGGNDIDEDAARGDAVCTGCGAVLEEQIIVSEVQFMENAMGGASVIGQYVSTDGTGSRGISMGSGFHHGYGKMSKEITLQNGKKRIQQLGDQLRLNQHCIDTAFNFFKMAVGKGITRGRKTMHVTAACLYIVCRTEGTPHMLLDFSDIVQANVYVLGRAYLQIARELCINIPALDPCLYIQRFAHKMEFADKTHDVSMTALRLVQRMKRDWMAQGRRPSGLCGAAILVAARIHNFNRSIKEIIKVVKIGETTIRKRLSEFEKTPSSQLTIDEFQKIDLEEEMDPPCFTEGKRKARLAQIMEDSKMGEIVREITDLEVEIEKELDESFQRKRRKKNNIDTESVCSTSTLQSEIEVNPNNLGNKELIDPAFNQYLLGNFGDAVHPEGLPSGDINNEVTIDDIVKSKTDPTIDKEEDRYIAMLEKKALEQIIMTQNNEPFHSGKRPTAASLGINEPILKQDQTADDGTNNSDGTLYTDDIDDDELDTYILSKDEVIVKTQIWVRANIDYLRDMHVKEEEELKNGPDVKKEATKKKRSKRKRGTTKEAHTAAEAMEKMLQEKKISSKINYDVLRDLNMETEKSMGVKPEPNVNAVKREDGKTTSGFNNRFKKPYLPIDKKIPTKTEGSPRKRPRLLIPQPIAQLDILNSPPSTKTAAESPIILEESGPIEYAEAEEYEEGEEGEEEEEEELMTTQQYGEEEFDEEILDD